MYNMEDGSLQSTAGGFQAMTQDLLTVLNDIPFSILPISPSSAARWSPSRASRSSVTRITDW